MKTKINKTLKSLIVILLISVNLNAFSQDIVRYKSGDSTICRITKITADTIYMQMIVRKNSIDTYIGLDKVKDYQFQVIETIKNETETSASYFIVLEDGTRLTGKVLSYDKNRINFDDNNFGNIELKAYMIKSIKKEDIEAYYLVFLADGNEFYGKILERRKTEIDFETKTLGKVTVPVINIKKMQKVEEEKIVEGSYWFSNPNNTRYFYGPSAFNLKKGEAYYQNVYVIANSANYGVTDHFSIGGGFVIPFAVYVIPKVNFKIAEKFYAGAGVLGGIIIGSGGFGIAYGITTYGTNEHNITLGAGYGFFDNESMERPIFNLNGMTRVSKKIALVTENWSIPVTHYDYVYDTNYNYTRTERKEYDTYISYGMRIMGEKITIDIAFVNSKDIVQELFVGIPYVDFVYKF